MRGPIANTKMRTERLQFMLAREEVDLLDDFRFRWPIPSRAAAIRELPSRGLATDGAVTSSNYNDGKSG
jgi:hypothetical protein